MWFASDQHQLAIAAQVCQDFRDAGPRFAAAGIAESDTYLEHWEGGETLFGVATSVHPIGIHALFDPTDEVRPFQASWSTNGLILDAWPSSRHMPASIGSERDAEATIQWMLNQLHSGLPPRRSPFRRHSP